MDWQEELDDIYIENRIDQKNRLSPEDLDMLWEMEQCVERINCYTDLLKERYEPQISQG